MDAKSPQLELGIFQFDIPTMIGTILTCIIVFLITYLGARGMQMRRPGKRQLIVEMIVGLFVVCCMIIWIRRNASSISGLPYPIPLYLFCQPTRS